MKIIRSILCLTLILVINDQWLWGFYPQHNLNVPIPFEKPRRDPSPAMFIFRHRGQVQPTINIVHLRTTIHFDHLEEDIAYICDRGTIFKGNGLNYITRLYPMCIIVSTTTPSYTYNCTLTERYRLRMNALNRELQQTCRTGQFIVKLAKDLFQRAAKTTKSILRINHQWNTTETGALVWEEYYHWELLQLSSVRDTTQQRNNHIIEPLVALGNAKEQFMHNQTQMIQKLRAIGEVITLSAFEEEMLIYAEEILTQTYRTLHQVQDMINGLYTSLNGKLSPKLINLTELQGAFDKLTQRAAKQQFTLISQNVAQVFRTDATILIHQLPLIIEVLTHIPTIDKTDRIDMFMLEPIPFIIHTIMKGAPTTLSWVISMSNTLIMVNQDGTAYESSYNQIDDCQKLGKIYICPNLIRTRTSPIDSCVISIYLQQLEDIKRLCPVKLQKFTEVAIRLNRFQTLLISQSQYLSIICRQRINGLVVDIKEYNFSLDGSDIISLPQDRHCVVSSLTHNWKSWPQMGTLSQQRYVPIMLNLTEMIPLTTEDLQSVQDDITAQELGEVNLNMIQRMAELKKLREKQQQSFYGLIIICNTMMILTTCLGYLYCTQTRDRSVFARLELFRKRSNFQIENPSLVKRNKKGLSKHLQYPSRPKSFHPRIHPASLLMKPITPTAK